MSLHLDRTARGSVLLSTLVMLAAAGTSAQKSLDFSGTWEKVVAPDAQREVKEILTVKQDKSGMTATFTPEGKNSAEVVRFEFGSTARQNPPAGAGDVDVSIATSWKGDVLVVVSTITVQGNARTFEQQWSVERGNELVIATTRAVGGSVKTTRDVYRRQGRAGVTR